MINGDEGIEVRGVRVLRSGSGPGWWTERTPRRPCGTVGLLRHAIENASFLCDRAKSHPFLDQYPVLELAREIDLLLTDLRTADPPWAPDGNA